MELIASGILLESGVPAPKLVVEVIRLAQEQFIKKKHSEEHHVTDQLKKHRLAMKKLVQFPLTVSGVNGEIGLNAQKLVEMETKYEQEWLPYLPKTAERSVTELTPTSDHATNSHAQWTASGESLALGATVTKIVEEVDSTTAARFIKKPSSVEALVLEMQWKNKHVMKNHAQSTAYGMNLELGAIAQRSVAEEQKQEHEK